MRNVGVRGSGIGNNIGARSPRPFFIRRRKKNASMQERHAALATCRDEESHFVCPLIGLCIISGQAGANFQSKFALAAPQVALKHRPERKRRRGDATKTGVSEGWVSSAPGGLLAKFYQTFFPESTASFLILNLQERLLFPLTFAKNHIKII